jgi:diguanylate cyclase (GGDEF)-like protein/hemerythrin-like metal-binding protein
MTDRLTGCWNRARIEQVVRMEMERAQLQNWPLSLLLIDIDHFKLVNDQHGHPVGDEVLKEFASVVYRSIRSTDVFGRWGGEEFLLFPTRGSYIDTLKLAERIRCNVEQHRFSDGPQITVSIGVAQYNSALGWTEWMKKVDLALYKAKNAGRNQVWTEQGRVAVDMLPDLWKMQTPWKIVYECGYREIDEQHQALLERVNQLMLLLNNGGTQVQAGELADTILQEVEKHFSDEGVLLESLNHEIAREHCRLHAALLEKARQMTKLYFSQHIGIEEFIQFYGYELIVQHTLVEDLHVFRKIQAIEIAGKLQENI